MKLLGKGKLQRGMLSASNASDTNFKPLHTHHGSELFPNLPLHEETGRRYKQLRRYYIRASKLIFFKVRAFANKGRRNSNVPKYFAIGTGQVTVQKKMDTITHYTPNNDPENVRMNSLIRPVANTRLGVVP
jgi:hypothetical protein